MKSKLIVVHNHPIPEGKLTDFRKILGDCGGCYLCSPRHAPDEYGEYRVDFVYYDRKSYKQHLKRWQQVTTVVIEKRNLPWWKKLWKLNNNE